MKAKPCHLLGIILGIILLSHANVHAQSGTWTSTSDGYWTNVNNWAGGIVANGATNTASIVANLGADRTITLGTTTRTIGHLAVTNLNATARAWTVSSASGTQYLTYDADGLGGGTSVVSVAANTTLKTGFFKGSSSLRKTGPGTWLLATTNSSYSSTLVVAEGTLSLEQINAAKSIPIRLDSGNKNCTLTVGAASDGATYAIGSLQVPDTGSGLVTLSKPNGGTRSVLTVSPVINKAVDIYVSGGGPLQLSGGISGSGSVRKTGTSGLYYSTGMSYTGGTTIRQGYIWLLFNSTSSGMPSGKLVVMGDELTGNNGVGIGLAGADPSWNGPRPNMQLLVTTNGTSAAIQAGLNGQNAGSYIVSGTIQIDRPYLSLTCNSTIANDLLISSVISGVGGIRTSGSNTKMVRINGANSYEGGTVVTAGRLRVYGSGTLGSGPVTVSAGTTLDLDTGTAISDSAAVSLAVGTSTYGVVDLLSDVEETVGTLTINGQLQYSGTYGATGSGATFINDVHFIGPGLLHVLNGRIRATLLSIK